MGLPCKFVDYRRRTAVQPLDPLAPSHSAMVHQTWANLVDEPEIKYEHNVINDIDIIR